MIGVRIASSLGEDGNQVVLEIDRLRPTVLGKADDASGADLALAMRVVFIAFVSDNTGEPPKSDGFR
ncbi:MAG: hypothetical protein VYA84_16905 [Planctomycetota bacterium]|nr:hypothetical protein [Planctomycetota bacterium]